MHLMLVLQIYLWGCVHMRHNLKGVYVRVKLGFKPIFKISGIFIKNANIQNCVKITSSKNQRTHGPVNAHLIIDKL